MHEQLNASGVEFPTESEKALQIRTNILRFIGSGEMNHKHLTDCLRTLDEITVSESVDPIYIDQMRTMVYERWLQLLEKQRRAFENRAEGYSALAALTDVDLSGAERPAYQKFTE